MIAHLEAENAYTEALTAPHRDLAARLYDEMLARIQQTDLTVPYREGRYEYYSRTAEGLQYPIHCRRSLEPEAPEQVILDLNALAAGKSFMALGAFAISDDGRLLAYTTDDRGFRIYDLHVRDLTTGTDLPDQAHDVGAVAWAADGRTVFYTIKDAAKREYRLYRHRLGEAVDPVVHEESDERFEIGIHRSRSRAYLFLNSASHTTREVHFLAADRPEDPWRVVTPRRQDHEYRVEHRGERFHILTNDRGRNFRLVEAPIDRPGEDHWVETLPHRADVMLEEIHCFEEHAVIAEREDGLVRLRVTDLRDGRWHRIRSPSRSTPPRSARTARSTRERSGTPTSRSPRRRRSTTTTWTRASRRCASASRSWAATTAGATRPSGFTPSAPDGAAVPISLVHPKGITRPAPLLLYAYGAYGVPLSASFSSNRFSLLDRGVVFAIAHVRGVASSARAWHDQGRMRHKRNTFTDFIAVAEHLIDTGWTRPDRLAIQGGSAGGLIGGRRRESAAPPVPCGALTGPVRRRDQHHERRESAPHRG